MAVIVRQLPALCGSRFSLREFTDLCSYCLSLHILQHANNAKLFFLQMLFTHSCLNIARTVWNIRKKYQQLCRSEKVGSFVESYKVRKLKEKL